jgi:hypothetical protein
MSDSYSWENVSAASTVVIKPADGILHSITVNTTAAGTIIGYDNASAASGKKIFTLKSNVAEQTFTYDIPFVNGLTIISAAASDYTVAFT